MAFAHHSEAAEFQHVLGVDGVDLLLRLGAVISVSAAAGSALWARSAVTMTYSGWIPRPIDWASAGVPVNDNIAKGRMTRPSGAGRGDIGFS